MFRNREEAGRQLAAVMKDRTYRNPLVLAIPRGGVIVGATLADELNAELDVIVSRKLRAPMQPELAIGAVAENGSIRMNMDAATRIALGIDEHYLAGERNFQLAEIARRVKHFRQIRPRTIIAGRSVIVTDDGIATGSTMIAALQLLRAQAPHELIAAVPVASPDRLTEVRRWCDTVVCLLALRGFYAISQFYEDFREIDDEEIAAILKRHCPEKQPSREVAQLSG